MSQKSISCKIFFHCFCFYSNLRQSHTKDIEIPLEIMFEKGIPYKRNTGLRKVSSRILIQRKPIFPLNRQIRFGTVPPDIIKHIEQQQILALIMSLGGSTDFVLEPHVLRESFS